MSKNEKTDVGCGYKFAYSENKFCADNNAVFILM